MKYNNLSNNGSLKSIDKKRLIKKIEKIENELINIKKQLNDEVGDA